MGAEQQQPLIPGLPDDIAMDCLVRLPYRFHSGLRSVCRIWRDLTTSPSFYHQRRAAGAAESLVCLVQAMVPPEDGELHAAAGGNSGMEKTKQQKSYSPPAYGLSLYNATLGSWHRLAATTVPLFAQCVAVPSAGKLVLLGGWDQSTLDSVRDVYVVDMVTGSHRKGKPMSAARSFFACAAVGPLVYIAGGHDNHKNALRTAEAYDPITDEWRSLPPMAEERDECQGMARNGKFWVLSGYDTENQGRFGGGAEVYDPASGNWTKEDGIWDDDDGGLSSAVTCFALPNSEEEDRLWQLECSGGRRKMREYDGKERKWRPAAEIPEDLKSSPCVAVVGGGADEVFVIGSDGEQRHKAWVMDGRSRNWRAVDTPVGFSGFVYSAATFEV